MHAGSAESGGFYGPNVPPLASERLYPELLFVTPMYIPGEPFEVATEDFPGLVADYYAIARAARRAGSPARWVAFYREAGLYIGSHQRDLSPELLEGLRVRLEQAGYYEDAELRDPFGLGPPDQLAVEPQ